MIDAPQPIFAIGSKMKRPSATGNAARRFEITSVACATGPVGKSSDSRPPEWMPVVSTPVSIVRLIPSAPPTPFSVKP